MGMKILLAAGGTGGHIIPAIAFGHWLQEHGQTPVLVTGTRPLEKEICLAHAVQSKQLPLEGSPLGVSGIRSLKRWRSLFTAWRSCGQLIREEKIDKCVLFGGYLSFPVLLAARLAKIPTILHEQNTVAGRVTRLSSKIGIPVVTAWNKCEGLAEDKFTCVGMPIRKILLYDQQRAQTELLGTALPEGQKLAVVLGGSLGSGGLAEGLRKVLHVVKLNNWSLLFMGVSKSPFAEARVHDACWDMAKVYSAADLIICRAGASTLAELLALNIPALVVPWMQSSEGHQQKNAQFFSELTENHVWIEGSSPDVLQNFFSASFPGRKNGQDPGVNGSERLWNMLCNADI